MYDRSSTKSKWTIMKYIKDFDKMLIYADAVRQGFADISDNSLDSIQEDMRNKKIYNPRTAKSNVVTIRNKVNQIAFYMFGSKLRKGKEQKIIFSPLGNLLLDNRENKQWVSRIFLSMLYSMEFSHPFNLMSEEFKLYPYRLIFKLLLDKRLCGKLFHDEVFYYVMFVKEIDEEKYEKLIKDILKLRSMSPEEKYNLFKKDESVLANSLHEWNYGTGILEQAGIVKILNDDNNKDRGNLLQGKNSKRRYKLNYIAFNDDIISFVKIMNDKYKYDDKILKLNDKLLRAEYINQMYNFYPEELLDELGIRNEEQEKIKGILKITDLIIEYSLNENNKTFNLFQDILCDGFNLFKNVRANVIAKAGTTDVECIYQVDENSSKKFDIEAKSTKMKLMKISAGRLRRHRQLINSQYTIVVTPEYAPAVKYDIEESDTVILLSRTLSNFIYQYSRKFGRDLDYKILDEIIVKNIGGDITEEVNNYIYNNLATSYL